MAKTGRNEPCPCGSGKKYKTCHMREEQAVARDMKVPGAIAMVGVVAGIGVGVAVGIKMGAVVLALGVLIAGAFAAFRDPPPSRGDGNPASINFGQ